MELTINDEQMKIALKDAIIEMINEKRELFYEIMLEAIEDAALANAISEGRQNNFVGEDKILELLGE